MTTTTRPTRRFHQTREAWLSAVTDTVIRPWFVELGIVLPPRIRFGVGWSHAGHRTNIVAECYVPQVSGDGTTEIIIGTNYRDEVRIVDAVVHELIHAAGFQGHDRAFAKCATDLGLVGNPSSTVAGPELADIVRIIVERFGPYPHAGINLGVGGDGSGGPGATPGERRTTHEKPKQGTRMLKAVCLNVEGECPTIPEKGIEGYLVRTTAKWLDDYGTPECPGCGQPLTRQA